MKNTLDSFNNRIHRVGRLTVLIVLFCFMLVPFGLSIIYGEPIDLARSLQNGLPLLLTFTVTAVCENLSWAPIIGPGALYMGCVTGNLSNMKVPAAMNSMQITGCESGSDKGDVIAILSVAASTVVTTIIVFAGMLFLAPMIEPLYNNPYLNPAFTNLLPILFGALLVPQVVRAPKESIPILLLPIVTILLTSRETFSDIQGYLILVFAVIAMGYSYLLHRKDLNRTPEEK